MTLDKVSQESAARLLKILATGFGIFVIGRICSRCGLVLGIKDGQGTYGLSHTYCADCAGKAKGERK